MFSFWRTIIKK